MKTIIKERGSVMSKIGLQFFSAKPDIPTDIPRQKANEQDEGTIPEPVSAPETAATLEADNVASAGVTATADEATLDTSASGTDGISPSGKKTREQYNAENNYLDFDGYSQKVGMKNEADWYAHMGLDPDKDYENTKKNLEYEYMTSMATYGANAERLYQMGLSNSGVSDIFQANAFSAYLSAQNDAATKRIDDKRANKLAYEQYVDGIKQDYATYDSEFEAGYNAYSSGYDSSYNQGYAVAYSSYDGTNEQDIRVALAAQGMDEDIINSIVSDIKTKYGNDISALPAVKAAKANIDSGFVLAKNTKGSVSDIRAALVSSGYSAEDAEKIIEKLKKDRHSQIETWWDADVGNLSFEEIVQFAQDNKEFGFDESVETVISKALDDIVDNEDALHRAHTFVGKSADEWAAMDDGEKLSYVLEFVGQNVGDYIKPERADSMFAEWANNQVDLAFEGANARSDVEALISKLQEYKSSGYITSAGYDKILQNINDNKNVKAAEKQAADYEAYAAGRKSPFEADDVWDVFAWLGNAAQKAQMGS